jgi:hypothetical protein
MVTHFPCKSSATDRSRLRAGPIHQTTAPVRRRPMVRERQRNGPEMRDGPEMDRSSPWLLIGALDGCRAARPFFASLRESPVQPNGRKVKLWRRALRVR